MVALEESPSRDEIRRETTIREAILRRWRRERRDPDVTLPEHAANVWYVDVDGVLAYSPWEYARVIMTPWEIIVTVHDSLAARPSMPGISGDPLPEFVSRAFY